MPKPKRELDEDLRFFAEEPLRGPEIDTGLHRPPIESFFLKGPIPLAELVPVAKMPGKTLALWLAIVHRVAWSKTSWVTFPPYVAEDWGISQDAKVDALRRLEQDGRIAVSKSRGGYLKVRLIWKKRKEKSDDDGQPRA
jgi:hypothetical protein